MIERVVCWKRPGRRPRNNTTTPQPHRRKEPPPRPIRTEAAPSLADQRRQSEQTALAQAGEPEAVAAAKDRLIQGPAGALSIRIYTPARAEREPLPALVITAEYDPVRDEAELYARRLEQTGTQARLSRYNGMIHSFFRMFALFEQSHQALTEVADALRAALAAA